MRKIITWTTVFLSIFLLTLSIQVFSAASEVNKWMEKAPIHVARYGLGVAVVDGKIFAIGGSTAQVINSSYASNGITGINEEYDPITNSWTMKSPMPTPRAYLAIGVYEGKIYCMGGISQLLPNGVLSAVNEVYDPSTDTWETKAPLKVATADMQANVVNAKIYVIGGYPNETTNQVYDPLTDVWTIKAPIPHPTVTGFGLYPDGFNSIASTVFNGKIYEVGSNVEIYDSIADNWTSVAIPTNATIPGVPVAASTSGTMAQARIYVFSSFAGRSGNLVSTKVYDPLSNNWTGAMAMPTFPLDYGVAVLNDTFYIIGGFNRVSPDPFFYLTFNDTPTAGNEQYTPAGYGTPAPSYTPPTESPSPTITALPSLNPSFNQTFNGADWLIGAILGIIVTVVAILAIVFYYRKRKHI